MAFPVLDGGGVLRSLKSLVVGSDHILGYNWTDEAGNPVEAAQVSSPIAEILNGETRWAFSNITEGTADELLTRVEEGTDMVAAGAGLRYYIVSLFLSNKGSVKGTVTLNSKGGGASTPIGPAITCGADGGGSNQVPFSGVTRCKVAENLTVSLEDVANFGPVGVHVGFVEAA